MTTNSKEQESLFWLLIAILFVRGFIVEPFKIPSGSLIPSMLIGDHLVVAKTAYDIGIPFTNIKLMPVADPKHGEIIVFRYPNNEQDPSDDGKYFVKRLIGLPGDEIHLENGVFFINGKRAGQQSVVWDQHHEQVPGYQHGYSQELLIETLPGTTRPHYILRNLDVQRSLPQYIQRLKTQTGKDCIEVAPKINGMYAPPALHNQICPFTVPDNHYFFVGDNRDNSSDGRDWGFVERKLLVGKALFVWFSLRPVDEGGLPYLGYEQFLNSFSGGILGAIVQFPRGLLYDLINWGENRYVRWERAGYTVK